MKETRQVLIRFDRAECLPIIFNVYFKTEKAPIVLPHNLGGLLPLNQLPTYYNNAVTSSMTLIIILAYNLLMFFILITYILISIMYLYKFIATSFSSSYPST